MIHNDYLRMCGLFPHLADVAFRKERAISPCALISIGIDAAAYVIGNCESQRFKVAGDVQFKFIDDAEQPCEVRVLEVELCLNALLFEAVEADIVAHTLDKRGFKILNMFLHTRNIFVKELFLQRFVGRADDRHFARTYDGQEVGEAVVGWNHRLASEIQVTLRLDLNTPYRT